jgi:Domain of unknown function (DUF4397)
MTSWRAALLLAILTLLFGISFAPVSSAATSGVGWIRLGDLSETLTPVDIYVAATGGSGATVVDKDIAYGEVLGPLSLTAGTYTVDFRDTGAPASSSPAASASVTVQAGRFYTVAPINVAGSGDQRHVVDLPDAASTPAGDASVQAIDAAVQHGPVTFHCSYTSTAAGNILTSAQTGNADSDAVPAGTWTMKATGAGGQTASVGATLAAHTDWTEIVLDTVSGVTILSLRDVVGDAAAKGGIQTGYGSPAPQGPGSPVPWLALIGAGVLITAGSGVRLARGGLRRQSVRG